MTAADNPSPGEICAAAADRLAHFLTNRGELLGEVTQAIMADEGRLLAERPQPRAALLVATVCASAGGVWQRALWPAIAMECAMAAADVFDDIADDEATALCARFGIGAVLMGAAALLALAADAVLRAVEDGVREATALALGQMLSTQLVEAAAGQARGSAAPADTDDLEQAYELAVAKSGPLGSLAARLGARTATDDIAVVDVYGSFGWHLAVFNQLMNDARDASPEGSPAKRDVRDGRRTVPLVFAGSRGAPPHLRGDELAEWEEQERRRVQAYGGGLAAFALAEVERLKAIEALDDLGRTGRSVATLREMLEGHD